MRAISFWQPWAQWVVDGEKAVETRPRPIRSLVGQTVAVHATLREPPEARVAAARAARVAGLVMPELDGLPHGALIGTVRVLDCVAMTPQYLRMIGGHVRERALGDYRLGRYALALAEPVRFRQPVPWKGKQGVFMVPDQVVATASCGQCLGSGSIIVPTSCFGSSLRPCPECRPVAAVSCDGPLALGLGLLP